MRTLQLKLVRRISPVSLTTEEILGSAAEHLIEMCAQLDAKGLKGIARNAVLMLGYHISTEHLRMNAAKQPDGSWLFPDGSTLAESYERK
jgi:hypothetical protein